MRWLKIDYNWIYHNVNPVLRGAAEASSWNVKDCGMLLMGIRKSKSSVRVAPADSGPPTVSPFARYEAV